MTEHKAEPPSTAKPSAQTQPAFRAVLTPHRSMSATAFLTMMVAIGVVSFFVGVAFLLMGAWPVMGFFGLDVALIYWAFRTNYRDGRAAETIEITPQSVKLVRIDPKGREMVSDFNTYWVRSALEERSDGRSHLNLVARGLKVRIADFLSDGERREFARVLEAELFAARNRTGF